MVEDVEVVLAVLRAVEERDRQALLALLHEDVEFHDAGSLPYGGVTRGKAEAREAARPEQTWIGTWGPLQPTPAERRMEPRVVARLHRSARHPGPDRRIVGPRRCHNPPPAFVSVVRHGK